jgi:hypothetical protein
MRFYDRSRAALQRTPPGPEAAVQQRCRKRSFDGAFDPEWLYEQHLPAARERILKAKITGGAP